MKITVNRVQELVICFVVQREPSLSLDYKYIKQVPPVPLVNVQQVDEVLKICHIDVGCTYVYKHGGTPSCAVGASSHSTWAYETCPWDEDPCDRRLLEVDVSPSRGLGTVLRLNLVFSFWSLALSHRIDACWISQSSLILSSLFAAIFLKITRKIYQFASKTFLDMHLRKPTRIQLEMHLRKNSCLQQWLKKSVVP